jgi:hypothetical protein
MRDCQLILYTSLQDIKDLVVPLDPDEPQEYSLLDY